MIVECQVAAIDSYRIWQPVCPPPSDWAWRGAEEEPCPASSDRRTPPPPAPRRPAAAPTASLHSCRVTCTQTHEHKQGRQSDVERLWHKTVACVWMQKHNFLTHITITKKIHFFSGKPYQDFCMWERGQPLFLSFPTRKLVKLINRLWGWHGNSPASRPRGVWGCRVL